MSRGGAVWSARMAHNHQVAGSNPAPATKKFPSVIRLGEFSYAYACKTQTCDIFAEAKIRSYRSIR